MSAFEDRKIDLQTIRLQKEEIERLKDKIKALELLNLMTDDEVVLSLKALCARAAETLETWTASIPEEWKDQGPRNLVTQLREAAK